MKALQQAAQNRSAKTGGEAAPANGAGPAARVEPAVSGSGPGTPVSADLRQTTTELSLEPLPVPLIEPADGAGADAIAPPARMMASSREPAPPPGRERQAASAAVAPAAARSDRRAAPRWSGDLQSDELPADRPTIDGEPEWRRSQLRAEASPARAGAVLAAGAGAARAGTLSRLSRLHWILILGGGAALVLFTYFYIQINHPGLFQRGFRSPPAATPLVGRPAPAPAPAANAGPGQLTGITAPVVPAPAVTGTVQAALATPDPASAGTAGIPASLAASPLLNPPPTAPAPIAGSAVPAPAALPPNTRTIPSAPPEPGRTGSSSPAPAIASEGSATTPAATAPGTPAAARAGNAAAGRTPAVAQAATATLAPTPAGDSIRVTRGSGSAPVNPALAEAWDHLQAGRLEAAQRLYSQVATAEPRNVDALLGLAAVAQLGNQAEAANRLWLRVLDIEPRNAHAQAALLGQIGRADPTAAETQLKSLIGREPSPFLYFTLGNLYADQNRWAQAQQAYFQAHHLQPGNADYAFNLAVGLERIGQSRLAATYLRTAIRLADAGSRPNFDVEAARRRASLLEASNGTP